jgi:hypothetical protein
METVCASPAFSVTWPKLRASAGLATARAIAIEDISNVVRTMAYSQPVLLPDLGNRADFFKQPS